MRILILDVETAPSLGWIWSLWKEVMSTLFLEKDWFIMCWSAKWLGEKEVFSSSIVDFKDYKKNPENDRKTLEKLWKLLDEADIVIAHNGIKFDKRKINTRFLANNMTPPSPYRMIDTLEVAKSQFGFTSNKLDDIAKFLKVGQKHDTGGFSLWKKCLQGDLKAWKLMVEYCIQDILLLEKVYLFLRPYIVNHPNINIDIKESYEACGRCGSENIHYRGYCYTNVSQYHRFVCKDCGGWGRVRENSLAKDKRKTVSVNT